MTNKTICIEREYGSNGKKIAEWLSKSTGIQCYDKEALKKVAEENNLLKEEKEGEDHDYIIYSEAIRFLADKKSCIFIGTCASAVLQGRARNLNVFIKADMESKILWAMSSEKADREKAKEFIAKMDEKRRESRESHAVTESGEPVVYDLVVTSSKFGIEGTAEVIKNCLSRI